MLINPPDCSQILHCDVALRIRKPSIWEEINALRVDAILGSTSSALASWNFRLLLTSRLPWNITNNGASMQLISILLNISEKQMKMLTLSEYRKTRQLLHTGTDHCFCCAGHSEQRHICGLSVACKLLITSQSSLMTLVTGRLLGRHFISSSFH